METIKLIATIVAAVTMATAGSTSAAPRNTSMTFSADTSVASRLYSQTAGEGMLVYASGVIDEGATARLLDFLKVNRIGDAEIVFDSPGGSLMEGMKMGRAIRQLHLFTGVGRASDKRVENDAICASACSYAFAGGVSRFLYEGGGRIGLHQFYTGSGSSASEGDTQIIGGLLAAYLNEMGDDAKAFALASVTDHEGVLWLTSRDALALGLANNGIMPTQAEVKLMEMHPYLRLEQDRYNVTTRYLFFCVNRQIGLNAGVVTNPTVSQFHAENVRRAYIELDGREVLVKSGPTAVKAQGSVLWLDRTITPSLAVSFLHAKVADIWVENGSAFRWGGSIDLEAVHPQMRNYIQQCLG